MGIESGAIQSSLVVNIGKGGQRDLAEAFASRHGVPITDRPGEALTLTFDKTGTSLSGYGLSYQGDFRNMEHRVTQGRLEHEMLVRAAKPEKEAGTHLRAIDATAGMGEDSFLLAAYGYEVTLFEQNPVVAALLKDAVRRARRNQELKEIAGRMEVIQGDSIAYLSQMTDPVDVIYLDPMFPKRQKSGLVNKKLQLIQKLEAPCASENELFDAALQAKPSKIIVKRPLKAPCLAGREPSYTLNGKAIRYDCYTL